MGLLQRFVAEYLLKQSNRLASKGLCLYSLGSEFQGAPSAVRRTW